MMVYCEKYETIDLLSTSLIPTPAYRGPDFDERLREVMDVDLMIEEDNK